MMYIWFTLRLNSNQTVTSAICLSVSLCLQVYLITLYSFSVRWPLKVVFKMAVMYVTEDISIVVVISSMPAF